MSHSEVFVIGAGPSLDGRIDFVRQVRDKAIVISCGTSLRSLAASSRLNGPAVGAGSPTFQAFCAERYFSAMDD